MLQKSEVGGVCDRYSHRAAGYFDSDCRDFVQTDCIFGVTVLTQTVSGGVEGTVVGTCVTHSLCI